MSKLKYFSELILFINFFLLVSPLFAVDNTKILEKPDKSKSLYYGDYKDISPRIFPGTNNSKPIFIPTTKIQAGFSSEIDKKTGRYGIIKNRYHFIGIRDRVSFTIQWEVLKIKKIALYHLDAFKAGHECCSSSSMEKLHCTTLTTLVAVFKIPPPYLTNYLRLLIRHSAVSFNRNRKISANMLIQAQTVDGKYYSYRFKLKQEVSFHFACSPRNK